MGATGSLTIDGGAQVLAVGGDTYDGRGTFLHHASVGRAGSGVLDVSGGGGRILDLANSYTDTGSFKLAGGASVSGGSGATGCFLLSADVPSNPRARAAQRPSDGDWRCWLILAGRGFGKTAACQWVRDQVETGRARRVALVAPTAADVRDVIVEGPSGILAVCPPWARPPRINRRGGG